MFKQTALSLRNLLFLALLLISTIAVLALSKPAHAQAACATPWQAQSYAGGTIVSYNGHNWNAKWWAEATNMPGAGDPWADNGTCSGGGGSATATPTTGGGGTGTVCVAAYEVGAVYLQGTQASYSGHNWTAKYWTQSAPSAAEWTDNGACTAPPPLGTLTGPVKIYYYPEWAVYGRDFYVADIEPMVQAGHITHIQYAFIRLEPDGSCKVFDSWAADEKPGRGAFTQAGSLRQMAALRDKYKDKIRIILSIGGWTLSQHFSTVSADDAKLATMATSCIDMMTKYRFDGLDIDYEYPGGGGVDGNSSDPINDAANYTKMAMKLRQALDAKTATTGQKYLLTAAVGAGEDKQHHMNAKDLAQYMDYISVMAYDLNGAWQTMPAHNAGLYKSCQDPRTGDPEAMAENYNVDYAIQLYLNGGTNKMGETVQGQIPPKQLVMGLAFYGRAWPKVPPTALVPGFPGLYGTSDVGTLTNGGTCNCEPDYANFLKPMWDASQSPAPLVDTTGNNSGGSWEESVFDYRDLKLRMLTTGGYTRYWDDEAKNPYAYNPNVSGGVLVAYDDPQSIGLKIDYLKGACLGGAMVWEMTQDRADSGYDLFKTVTNGLAGYDPANCTRTITAPKVCGNETPMPSPTPSQTPLPGTTPTATPTPMATTPAPTSTPTTGGGSSTPVKIYYYPEWAVYGRDFYVADIEPLVQAGHITHLQYAFIRLEPDGSCKVFDSWAADEKPGRGTFTQLGSLRQMAALRDKYKSQLKILLSIGGWTLSDNFSAVAKDPTKLATMANSCVQMMMDYKFDGLDIDWEYPGGGGLNPSPTVFDEMADRDNYTKLAMTLRQALDAKGPGYLLTAAVGAGEDKQHHMDAAALVQYMDYISVMAYDLNGAWQNMTAHNAGLYKSCSDPRTGDPAAMAENYNVDYAIQMFLNGGTNKMGEDVPGKIPPSKLVLGVPFYGRSWAKVPNTPLVTGLPGLYVDGDPGANVGTSEPDYANMLAPMWDGTTSPGTLRDSTGNNSGGSWEESVWDYRDIKLRLLTTGGYTRYWDPQAEVPYLYNAGVSGGTMISYDDVESIGKKMDYLKGACLGGAMVWELTQDRTDSGHDLFKTVTNKLTGYNPGSCTRTITEPKVCGVQPTATPTVMPTNTPTVMPTVTPIISPTPNPVVTSVSLKENEVNSWAMMLPLVVAALTIGGFSVYTVRRRTQA